MYGLEDRFRYQKEKGHSGRQWTDCGTHGGLPLGHSPCPGAAFPDGRTLCAL
jgi:hypothetical protein